MNALAEKIKELGLNPNRAADLCGMSNVTVYRHISGERSISAEAAVKYEAGLGVPRHALRPDLWPTSEAPA